MRFHLLGFCILLILAGSIGGCSSNSNSDNGGKNKKTSTSSQPGTTTLQTKAEVPEFSGDSAYVWVEKQLSFGPRVPNTGPHFACADWMVEKFESFGAKVTRQGASVQDPVTGQILNIQNIIASYNPEQTQRIMLSAHWDTRPVGDQDSDTGRRNQPIPGANDGASGVAVLLEIARHLSEKASGVGVDIFLWDAEDGGNSNIPNSFCLGSQYWAQNKHIPGYQAMWGINLDMVGASGARFYREGQSMQYAASVVDRVWRTAALLGHEGYFTMERTPGIIDDHYYINTMAGIPMIDIIDQQPDGQGFFPHWHTHADDIHTINPETLRVVGQTVMSVVYWM